jgi:hypothetical protein
MAASDGVRRSRKKLHRVGRPTITGATDAFGQRLLSCASGPFTGPILKVAFGRNVPLTMRRAMTAICAFRPKTGGRRDWLYPIAHPGRQLRRPPGSAARHLAELRGFEPLASAERVSVRVGRCSPSGPQRSFCCRGRVSAPGPRPLLFHLPYARLPARTPLQSGREPPNCPSRPRNGVRSHRRTTDRLRRLGTRGRSCLRR